MHLAQLLHSAGHRDEAVRQAAAVLQREPANLEAMALISGGAVGSKDGDTAVDDEEPDTSRPADPDGDPDSDVLSRLDAELADIVAPEYADAPSSAGVDGFDVERVGLRLSGPVRPGGVRRVAADVADRDLREPGERMAPPAGQPGAY